MANATVLIVEDSADARELIHCILDSAGFAVTEAEDGEEAWQSLEHSLPDLLLTDLTMPRLDGFELIRRVRARVDLARLPIVAVTACVAAYGAEALKAGATTIIQKPIDPDYLEETVNQLLPKDRRHWTEIEQKGQANAYTDHQFIEAGCLAFLKSGA